MNAKFQLISYYSSLKLWILAIKSMEVILRSSHWRRSAKIYKVYSCICVQNLQKISVKEFNFSKVVACNFNEQLNSFAGIFLLVLAQLQNQFFVDHLPVAAYVRYLKEKEWKKCVFIALNLTFFFVELQGSVGEIRAD